MSVKDRDIDFGSQRPTSSLLGKKFVDEKVLFSHKKTTSTNQKRGRSIQDRGFFKIGVYSDRGLMQVNCVLKPMTLILEVDD